MKNFEWLGSNFNSGLYKPVPGWFQLAGLKRVARQALVKATLWISAIFQWQGCRHINQSYVPNQDSIGHGKKAVSSPNGGES